MKVETEVSITTNVSQTVKAMEKVTLAAKQMQAAIEELNRTTIVVNTVSAHKNTKRWYQFWL